uniref:Protein THEMIS n=1 Tax=Geotrypetes seraphini TaxID=260995 RepID=A0A6P8Q061_GEOSA|nr:protein THEMIS [Geotrypetes seraphini]
MATSLETFIHSLDPKSLPRALQIQSGIYYQGSIYEMYGNECCFSTGEIIKVIGFKIKKIIATICGSTNDGESTAKMELPLDFPGLFQIKADPAPYHSIEEITKTLHIGHSRFGHPRFYSQEDIKLSNLLVSAGEQITFSSVEEVDGMMALNCGVLRNNQHHSFALPLSQRGEFYECEDDQIYTLTEITEWKMPKSRTRTVTLSDVLTASWDYSYPFPEKFEGTLALEPVYEIQAVMKYRKDIVHILSDLDIEVIDITEHYNMNCFLQPLSTHDIFERTSKEFPFVAEIIEGPRKAAHCSLRHGMEIIIHKKYQALRILASEIRSDSPKRHFLIPYGYKGKLKRRPRTFQTAYDLEIAKSKGEQLHVVATKAFEASDTELSSLNVGDQFLVNQCETSKIIDEGRRKQVDVLGCEKIEGKNYEKVLLPLHVEGNFVEVVHDKKQYHLSELCKKLHLPFNVKVSVRDLSIGEDILAAVPGLQLEEEITDSYLLISILEKPEDSWEIPVHRLNLTVQLVNKPVEKTVSSPTRTIVEEISEEQYYMVRRYETPAVHPPPRPPKRPIKLTSTLSSISIPLHDSADQQKSPKSLHADISRKLYIGQATASELQDSYQNYLLSPENEEDKNGRTTSAESNVAKAYRRNHCRQPVQVLERRVQEDSEDTDLPIRKAVKDGIGKEPDSEKHDYEYIDENLVDDIRKKLHDSTFCGKSEIKKEKASGFCQIASEDKLQGSCACATSENGCRIRAPLKEKTGLEKHHEETT